MDLIGQLVVALSALAALVAVAALLFLVRVVVLVRHGGAFDCSWRRVPETSGGVAAPGVGGTQVPGGTPVVSRTAAPSRWTLGVAHVGTDALDWWRVFSISPRPRSTWHRLALEVLDRRSPEPGEAPVLFTGAVVVRCAQSSGGSSGQPFELAMSPDAYTGFASWLESSPPRDRGGVM